MQELSSYLLIHGYTLLSPIGSGATAKCYLVQSNHYQISFVCKVVETKVNKKADLIEKTYYSELEALSNIIHTNIIKLYDFFKHGTKLFLILEYCKGGSLDKIIETQPLNLSLLRNYLRQLIDSLAYCHSIPLAHHDLKPANIFLDEYNRIKLADFGLAQMIKGQDPMSQAYSGSIPFMAPEIFDRKPYDPLKADVWALGVTVYQLLTGKLPFYSSSVKGMVSDMRNERYIMSNDMPKDIATVIKMCLVPNPFKRANISDLKGIVAPDLPTSDNNLNLKKKRHGYSLSSYGKLLCSNERLCKSKTHETLPPLRKAGSLI